MSLAWRDFDFVERNLVGDYYSLDGCEGRGQVLIAMRASHKLLVGKEVWQRSASWPEISKTSRIDCGSAPLPIAQANEANVATGPSLVGTIQYR